MPTEVHYLGCDLGQSRDPSALVALRQTTHPDPRRPGACINRYTVRGIKRWPLGTLYPQVVRDVVQTVSTPPLAGSTMGVDYTGCGRPVVDLFYEARPAAKVQPILITSGSAVSADANSIHVPKRELVSVVAVLLQAGRLDIPSTIPEAEILGKELLAFRATISAKGNEQFEADWRQKAHDDILLALAIAAWLGENTQPEYTGPLVLDNRSLAYFRSEEQLLQDIRDLIDQKKTPEAQWQAIKLFTAIGVAPHVKAAVGKILEEVWGYDLKRLAGEAEAAEQPKAFDQVMNQARSGGTPSVEQDDYGRVTLFGDAVVDFGD